MFVLEFELVGSVIVGLQLGDCGLRFGIVEAELE